MWILLGSNHQSTTLPSTMYIGIQASQMGFILIICLKQMCKASEREMNFKMHTNMFCTVLNLLKKRTVFFPLLFFVMAWFYLGVVLKVPYNSDYASLALIAKSVIDGNILLNGWTLSTQSFLTTELPFYVLGELIFGFSAKNIYILGALHWALVVVLIIFFCSTEKDGIISFRRAFISFCFTFYLSLVIIRTGWLAGHLIQFSYSIVCLLMLRKLENRVNWQYYTVYGILFVLGAVGDSFALYIIGLPVIIVCSFRILAQGPKKLPVLLILITVLSIAFSKGIIYFITILGGPALPGVPAKFVDLENLGNNFYLFMIGILDLFGVELFGLPVFSLGAPISIIRLSGMLLFFASLYYYIKNFQKLSITIQVIIVIIITNLLEYLFSNVAVNRSTMRYLPPSLIFGIVLITSFVLENSVIKSKQRLFFIYLLILLAAIIPTPSFTKPPFEYAELGSFLASHNLTDGYGPFWSANSTTLYTKGKVSVRAVISPDGKTVQPFQWLSEERWYKKKASFLIIDDEDELYQIPSQVIVDSFGVPDQLYTLGRFTILVWNNDISLRLSNQ